MVSPKLHLRRVKINYKQEPNEFILSYTITLPYSSRELFFVLSVEVIYKKQYYSPFCCGFNMNTIFLKGVEGDLSTCLKYN